MRTNDRLNGTQDHHDPRPLKGASAVLITDGKAGMDVQVRGVADALGLDYRMLKVAPKGLYRLLAPYGPAYPADIKSNTHDLLSPPWPDVVIATGRQSIPVLRALKRRAGLHIFSVVLQNPRTSPRTADLIWVPAHDRRRGANVITSLTAPHSFTASRLATLRATLPPSITTLPQPRIAVMLGGANAVYRFTDDDLARFARALQGFKATGASFLITPSRRTEPPLIAAVTTATEGAPRLVWDGTGENPYGAFLAAADVVIVTADSVNMVSEAAATGRPVYVFNPTGGSAKFNRFHEAIAASGATVPLDETSAQSVAARARQGYVPLDSGSAIAAEIERRFERRRQMLAGLVGARKLTSAHEVRHD